MKMRMTFELFFRTFNDAMAEYLNEPGYIWDPCLIMMDEKGANFEAIRRVFGTNFAKTKAKTCQFHFANCGERYISHLPIDYRNTFRNLCRKLCEAYTRDEYRTIEEKIRTVAEKYYFMGWWTVGNTAVSVSVSVPYLFKTLTRNLSSEKST